MRRITTERVYEYMDYMVEHRLLRTIYSWEPGGVKISYTDMPSDRDADFIFRWVGWAKCYGNDVLYSTISAENFMAGNYWESQVFMGEVVF